LCKTINLAEDEDAGDGEEKVEASEEVVKEGEEKHHPI